MAEQLKLLRPYLLLLGVFAVARFVMGPLGVPYGRGHHVFSVVTLTAFSCVFYGAFVRRWRGQRLMQAIVLGFLVGAASQLAILLMTLLSYALSLETYFNHPVALNLRTLEAADLWRATNATPADFGTALVKRLGGLIGNSIFAGILGAIGWTIGGLLPEK